MYTSVGVLLEYLRKDYRGTLARIANLTTHGEITFDLLYAVLVPRTVVVTECPVTGEPRALQVLSASKVENEMCTFYNVLCESVDSTEEGAHPGRRNASDQPNGRPSTATDRLALLRSSRKSKKIAPPPPPGGGNQSTTTSAALKGPSFGRVQSKIIIFGFKGTQKINSLEAYPIKYHTDPEGLRTQLLERGRKWASLKGIHHMHYDGTAALIASVGGRKKLLKYNVSNNTTPILCLNHAKSCVLRSILASWSTEVRQLSPYC